ncbi:MAG TPA: ribbon-helix-helix protein, CopG family [Ideonella sp.]|jgi:antitoxin component of RelBE/YafQ-DinJ toxin-antitoxin module|nr:ribbon-helix-helix protein, CopG family [Ideonella sp.]
MELKTARLTILIDPNKKAAFERLCARLDLTASQVVRQMIRDFLAQHGVSYTPSGEGDEAAATAAAETAKRRPAPAAATRSRRRS